LQVDFVVISRRDDGTLGAAIVDPHGDHLADAKSKLRALADYAETYASELLRIESVAKAGAGLRTLDFRTQRSERRYVPSRAAGSPRSTSRMPRAATSDPWRHLNSTARAAGARSFGRRSVTRSVWTRNVTERGRIQDDLSTGWPRSSPRPVREKSAKGRKLRQDEERARKTKSQVSGHFENA